MFHLLNHVESLCSSDQVDCSKKLRDVRFFNQVGVLVEGLANVAYTVGEFAVHCGGLNVFVIFINGIRFEVFHHMRTGV